MYLQLDPQYKSYRVGVDMEPYCGRTNVSHFWLSAEEPEHELRGMDLVSAVCSGGAQHEFCPSKEETELKTVSHDPETGQRSPQKCTPNVCYTANIVVLDKVYSMGRQCANVAKYYPILETPKRSQSHASTLVPNTLISIALFMFLVQ